jgi:MFS family permease
LFSIWAVISTSLAYFIGGGPPMATAMVWTILCDAIPAKERTSAFYRVSALGIILGAVLNPIAAWLMSMDPWLPMWIGIIFMALGTLSALLVPETLRLRKEADDAHRRRGSATSEALLPNEESPSSQRKVPPKAYAQELLLGAKKNTEHIWRFILASKSVMLLVAGCGFFFPIRMSFETFMLQYTTKRFDWSWSTVKPTTCVLI